MKQHHHQGDLFDVTTMCRVFGVSTSGYYAWLQRKPSVRAQETERLKIAIRATHFEFRQSYGAVRLQPELHDQGFMVGRDRLHRIKKYMSLNCKQKKNFKITTNSEHDLAVSPNLLEQNFSASKPNQIWTTDITYISTLEGWLYLAAIKDLFSKEIVGYAMSSRMTTALVSNALLSAVQNKRPPPDLIHHS